MLTLDRFVPAPLREDVESLRRGRVIVGVAFALTALIVAGTSVRYAIAEVPSWIMTAAFLNAALLLVTPYILRVSGSLRLAGFLVVASLAGSLAAVVLFWGGLETPVLVTLPLIPVLATVLFDGRAGVSVSLALGVGLLFVLLAPVIGVSLPTVRAGEVVALARGLWLLNALVMAGIFAGYYGRQRRLAREREEEREAMLLELAEKNADLERFTYTVSHDLKSPLITIRGFLALLRKDLDEGKRDQVEKDITNIANAAKKMQFFVDDLLELSRIRRQPSCWSEVCLASIAQDAVDLLSGHIEERQASVSVDPELPTIEGDPTLLRMVFQNLIENAVKFSAGQEQPAVKISRRRDDVGEVIFVEDNGIGISAEFQEKIFGLFEQLDPENRGTGIGLTTVRRAVEVHGGKIWVESEGEGRGSRFCFTLAHSGAGALEPIHRPPG